MSSFSTMFSKNIPLILIILSSLLCSILYLKYSNCQQMIGRRLYFDQMSQKRTLMPDVFKQKKRLRSTPPSKPNGSFKDDLEDQINSSEVEVALTELRPLFPLTKFEHKLPPIMIKHQLYSKISDRNLVEEQMRELEKNGKIKVFTQTLPGGEQTIELVVFTKDYRSHIQCVMTEYNIPKHTIDKFVSTIIDNYTKETVNKDLMMNHFSFNEAEITQLIKVSALMEEAAGSWSVSVPNAGIFMKSLTLGRQAVITMLKKCKYREVLRQELEQRPWPRVAKLGLLYHIHDIIGAGLVERCLPIGRVQDLLFGNRLKNDLGVISDLDDSFFLTEIN